MHARLTDLIRSSLLHAQHHPEASAAYVAEHASEMAEGVRRQHIELYVNEHSLDVGEDGESAARELLERGQRLGLFGQLPEPLFAATG